MDGGEPQDDNDEENKETQVGLIQMLTEQEHLVTGGQEQQSDQSGDEGQDDSRGEEAESEDE